MLVISGKIEVPYYTWRDNGAAVYMQVDGFTTTSAKIIIHETYVTIPKLTSAVPSRNSKITITRGKINFYFATMSANSYIVNGKRIKTIVFHNGDDVSMLDTFDNWKTVTVTLISQEYFRFYFNVTKQSQEKLKVLYDSKMGIA